MKKLILLSCMLLQYLLLFSQASGTVSYQEKARLHFNIQGNVPPPAGLPTERGASSVLYYTPQASLYRNDPAKEEQSTSIDQETEEGGVHIRMDAPDNQFYCDLVTNQCTDKREFMQRNFLIERELNSAAWKLTGKQKMILNYPCQEATREENDRKITAWYTPAIPVSTGPASFTGLPGLILEVVINDGDQTFTAISVQPDAAVSSYIVKPKEGKKVTEEEFNKIREEKMKEMGIENGSGNNVIIRINER